jgi:hypothetical protein
MPNDPQLEKSTPHLRPPLVRRPFAGDPPTVEDRVCHEKLAAWSYHFAEGWKMVDNPLTVPGGNTLRGAAPTNLQGLLQNAGYDPQPLFVVGDEVAAYVYEARATATFLVVLTVQGSGAAPPAQGGGAGSDGAAQGVGAVWGARQFFIARGFPSLLDVLRSLGTILDKGKAHAP